MAEAVNARSGPKRVRKKSFALEGKNNARSRQCPKRSMPEAVASVRGKKAFPWESLLMSLGVKRITGKDSVVCSVGGLITVAFSASHAG